MLYIGEICDGRIGDGLMDGNGSIENKKLEEKIQQLTNELENSILEQTRLEEQLEDNFRIYNLLYKDFERINKELAEQKGTEQELRKLTCAVEQSPESIIITDPAGNITYANPSFTRVTGYSMEEVLGRNPRILKSGKLSAEFYKNLWVTIKSGRTWHGEFLNKNKKGESYWESASISPIFNENGLITNYVAVKENITELKRSASELSKAKEEAEKANVAKSVFLANMSHEIRTPMNAILGFTQLMMKDKQLNSKQRQHLNTINISGEHLLNLINDILEMSKIDAGRVELMPVVFDIYSFVNDIKRMLEPHVLAKNLELIIKTDESLEQYMEADEGRMRQIFINLIGNAMKFTDQGSITWSLKTVEEKDGYACLISEVEDTGVGISKEDIKKLFKAFEQTETGIKAGGTGLGLAISLKLAKMMGGGINVQSEKGKGSCFRVVLYVKKAGADKTKQVVKYRSVIGIKDGQKPYKVLVVDDKDENRLLLCEMLQLVGFETQEASNGIEAIASFNEWSPNVILMDMRMPIMDGYETMSIIKATAKGKLTPIIAVTASVFLEDKSKMIAAGASNYIRKPFKENDLFEAIEACIGVKYDYEDYDYDNSKLNQNSQIDLKEIKLLPSGLIVQIKEATINGDSEKLFEIIEEVSKTLPQLATQLWDLANDYKYEQLLKLFE